MKIIKIMLVVFSVILAVSFFLSDKIAIYWEFNSKMDSILDAAKTAKVEDREIVLASDLKGFEYTDSENLTGLEIKGVPYIVSKVSSLSQVMSIGQSSQMYLYLAKEENAVLSGALCFAGLEKDEEGECLPLIAVNRIKGCEKENSQLECQDKKDVEL